MTNLTRIAKVKVRNENGTISANSIPIGADAKDVLISVLKQNATVQDLTKALLTENELKDELADGVFATEPISNENINSLFNKD